MSRKNVKKLLIVIAVGAVVVKAVQILPERYTYSEIGGTFILI